MAMNQKNTLSRIRSTKSSSLVNDWSSQLCNFIDEFDFFRMCQKFIRFLFICNDFPTSGPTLSTISPASWSPFKSLCTAQTRTGIFRPSSNIVNRSYSLQIRRSFIGFYRTIYPQPAVLHSIFVEYMKEADVQKECNKVCWMRYFYTYRIYDGLYFGAPCYIFIYITCKCRNLYKTCWCISHYIYVRLEAVEQIEKSMNPLATLHLFPESLSWTSIPRKLFIFAVNFDRIVKCYD